jgi:hypothetical protein
MCKKDEIVKSKKTSAIYKARDDEAPTPVITPEEILIVNETTDPYGLIAQRKQLKDFIGL